MTDTPISPGLIALHSHRSEVLAQTLAAWLQAHPLGPLEREVVLVQSNGMAEWIKMALAEQTGVCAATQVELPSRFMWRTYRQVLGAQAVPAQAPLDKWPMTWRLMALLPACAADAPCQSVAQWLRADAPDALLAFASSLADVFDQYQMYRPDWLADWAAGRDELCGLPGAPPVPMPQAQRWQAHVWRRLLATLSERERQATRPALQAQVLAHLRQQLPCVQPVARRVSVFGMSHMPAQLLELLAALAGQSQVLLAVPNPCQYHWADIMDGRQWLHTQLRRRHADRGQPLALLPLSQMHLHAPTLLAAWGRQGRDFMAQLAQFDDVQAAQALTQWPRLDFFDDVPGQPQNTALAQLQRRIRDLEPSTDAHPATPLEPHDSSVRFAVAHSPVRELEALHDQLLDWFHTPPVGGQALTPRDVVVMVPDVAQVAPHIRAVFGQYKRGDARHVPFDIADAGALANAPLLHALEWLLALPQKRGAMSELVSLLEVPAVAARFGLAAADVPALAHWMAGSGLRWGLSEAHREGLGLGVCGPSHTLLFAVQRMLMGYACGAMPAVTQGDGVLPYDEVAGLDARLAGSLAHLLQALLDWWQQGTQQATPAQWAQAGRDLLAAVFQPQTDADRHALDACTQALADWVQACDAADFAQPVPLAVARSAWLQALQAPKLTQRFRAGGVTFCTLMPMRAIPFGAVCLLGMNDGDYPRRSPRSDWDLMAQPGTVRPGDRSRQGDDRQLMLEALLSARQVLYVSWAGRHARDNAEQPPSVLVSQLREEIDLLWGAGTAAGLTTTHPLQPFGRAYFEEGSPLQTFAHEWRAVQDAPAPQWPPAAVGDLLAAPAAPAAPALPSLPALDSAQGPVPLSLADLAQFLRKPVAAFFRRRLQVQWDDGPALWADDEPFEVQGLAAYGLLAQALAQASLALGHPDGHMNDHSNGPTQSDTQGHIDAQVRAALAQWHGAGALPLAGVGQLQGQQLAGQLRTMLAALAQARAGSVPAARVQVQLGQEVAGAAAGIAAGAVQLQDVLTDLHQGPNGVQWLSVRPSRLVQAGGKSAGKAPPQPRPEALLHEWLVAMAAAAMGQPLVCVVVGRDALLHLPAPDAQQARLQLQLLLAVWAQGMCWPLPLPPQLALAWLDKPEATPALTQAYEGSVRQRGMVAQDAALARVCPRLADVLATGALQQWAHPVYGPLREWARSAHVQMHSTAPINAAINAPTPASHAAGTTGSIGATGTTDAPNAADAPTRGPTPQEPA